MKKFLVIALSLMLVIFCAACSGVYTPPIQSNPNGGTGTNVNKPGDEDKDNPGSSDEGLTYSVQLMCEGKPYLPQQLIRAQWIAEDGNSVVTEAFNTLGKATATGLDGEYRVSLSNVPDDFTYNPNGNYADNNKKDITIELLPIISTTGSGVGLYESEGCIKLTRTGTYRAHIVGKGEGPLGEAGSTRVTFKNAVYYQYTPTSAGKYTIQSWCDTTVNEVNPKIARYYGQSTGKYLYTEEHKDGVYDDGGDSSDYTKNFKLEIEIGENGIGNSWTFGVMADTKGEYPVDVDFTISYEGEYVSPETRVENIIAQGPFLRKDGDGVFHYFYNENGGIFDGSKVKLNPADNFYHRYNPETGEYGELVYCVLTQDSLWFRNNGHGVGFLYHYYWDQHIELRGYDLRIGIGDINNKEKFYEKDYFSFMATYAGYTETPGSDPRVASYTRNEYCNKDGAHPVNEELKTFLYEFAVQQGLFKDGQGDCEALGMNSSEEDQWMFCCGYYA